MALNNAILVETDFSPYCLTYGYYPTFNNDYPEFTGAEKRMKEQPRQFLACLLADWNHVYEIFRKNQDRYVQRSNIKIKAHRLHVGDLVLVSAAKHHETHSVSNTHWHPRRRYHLLSKPKSVPAPSLSTYHPGSRANSTTPSTRAT